MISGHSVAPDSKKAKLKSSDQEASPSIVKNTGIVSVPCCSSKLSGYSRGPWVSFVMTHEF